MIKVKSLTLFNSDAFITCSKHELIVSLLQKQIMIDLIIKLIIQSESATIISELNLIMNFLLFISFMIDLYLRH